MNKYKGYDFTELFPVLGLDVEEDDDKEFQEALLNIMSDMNEYHARHEELISEVREFVSALASDSHNWDYWWPLWDGLSKIEDDYTFMQACAALAPHLWT